MLNKIERNPIIALRIAITFLTCIPVVSKTHNGNVLLSSTVWMFPVVGAVLGICGAIVFLLCDIIGLPPEITAVVTIVAMYVLTGGLHEDALSDVADGFGGGASRERKLAIMRDSQIGSYGAAAIAFSILFRVMAIATFSDFNAVFPVLVTMGSLSRGALALVMAGLPFARKDGLSVDAGRPEYDHAILSLTIAVFLSWFMVGFISTVLVFVLTCFVIVGVIFLANRQIGGQTGDVLGTVVQVVEVLVLGALSIS